MLQTIMHHVDHFRLVEDDDGKPRLSCAGWIHARDNFAHAPNRDLRISLSVPGDPDLEISVTDCERDSPDVAVLLGQDAASARFVVDVPVEVPDARFDRSRLIVAMPVGDELSVNVGRLLAGRLPDPARQAADRALVMKFEGFGNNCEFGLLQRKIGFNRMGLLRFGGSYDNHVLADAVRDGFEALGDENDIRLSLRGQEWMVESVRYGFDFHTYRYSPEYSEERMRADEAIRLGFQAGMLLDLMEDAGRIFVRRMSVFDRQEGMDALFDAMRVRGPVSMLWVTNADRDHPHATIERLRPGFYMGYHGSLARTSWPTEFDKEGWLSLLSAAERRIHADNADDGASLAVRAGAPAEAIAE